MPRVKGEPSKSDFPWNWKVIARPEPHTDSVQATFHDKPEDKKGKLNLFEFLASRTIHLRSCWSRAHSCWWWEI